MSTTYRAVPLAGALRGSNCACSRRRAYAPRLRATANRPSGARRNRRVEVSLQVERWGGYRAGAAGVWVSGPLGGVWYAGRGRRVRVRVSCPASSGCARCAWGGRRPPSAPRSPMRGDGLELSGRAPTLRRPGDQLRRMHWRATARSGSRYVADRHPERSADVVLFLDAFAELPAGPRGTDAHAHGSRCRGVGQAHLRARDRVGVVRFGGALERLRPATGVLHALRIADALARSEIVMTYVARATWPLCRQRSSPRGRSSSRSPRCSTTAERAASSTCSPAATTSPSSR